MRIPPKRTHTRDKFTTYLNISALDSDRSDDPPWLRDERLHRHFERHQQSVSNSQERFWVAYWHNQWKQSPQSHAKGHLFAYLQTPCFWAARSFAQTLSKTPYTVIDCFQICFSIETGARESDNRQLLVEKILWKFNPATTLNLEGYAQTILKNALAYEIYKLTKIRTCSDWSLLNHKDIGDEVLKNALEREGFSEGDRERIRLMRECFKLYFNGQSPSLQLWQSATDAYNQSRLNYGGWAAITANELEDYLQRTARAIRSFYALTTKSLDAPIGYEVGEGKPLVEMLEDPRQLSPSDEIANVELWQQVEALLIQAFQSLPPHKQTLLCLKYKSNPKLDNYAIAERLKLEGSRARKGNKVSQLLKSAKLALAKALKPWVQQIVHTSDDAPLDVIDGVTRAVDLWLDDGFISNEQLRAPSVEDRR